MTPKPTPAQVRRAFGRAAQTYDAAAAIQRQAGQLLDARLGALDCAPRVVLDAGCGTGFGLRLLAARWPQARLLALDIAAPMLRQVGDGAARVQADVHHLPLADACVDLYWSCLTLQWCDLARALAEARRVLRSGGWLALATLGQDTFTELRHAFAAADEFEHTVRFADPAPIVQQAGFVGLHITRQRLTACYPDLTALLHAIRRTGANQLGSARRRTLLGRQAWQRVQLAYETLRQPDGLPLGYDLYLIAARRA